MNRTAKPSHFWKLIISVLICEVTGLTSGFLSNSGRGAWFDSLQKPDWNPPGYVFGPVWTFLYLLMGISLWLIWKSNAPRELKTKAILLFAIQLFLNFWWSMIFFKFQSPGLALIEIAVLAVTILMTIFAFDRISKPAAWLLVPYMAWVCFATVLNYSIWNLNN
jgi:tryptophan-rich sensory protein